jgi:hypothetical protein
MMIASRISALNYLAAVRTITASGIYLHQRAGSLVVQQVVIVVIVTPGWLPAVAARDGLVKQSPHCSEPHAV